MHSQQLIKMVEVLNDDDDVIENHLLMIKNDDVDIIEDSFYVEHWLLL